MARNIMIQGTMSNAGKSLLTAGILRVLKQDGYRAAPFKSQNMALNSYITEEGLEMGRAQVMQAEAAGIAPQVCMNPILLKPTSDVGSQVIVNGEVRGNYSAADYFGMKRTLIPDIMAAYHKLEEQADVIVIEGAGSPAEINLKQDDIVNMGLAKLVDAPVLLVGDIDRGGVFAQLLGTVVLLEEEERARIKGFVINKFRGDARLLEPGPSMLYEKCGIETLGVMPYLQIQIDDEDSLSEQLEYRGVREETERGMHDLRDILNLAVIRLPHISNFTDFNPLNRFPFVSVQYVDKPEQLAGIAAGMGTAGAGRTGVDLIILPGSKNTIQDMRWLRESGMEAAVLKQAAGGSRIMGICGGYQMLGSKICDPGGVEAAGITEIRGMGLLPVTTVLREKKRRSRIAGSVCCADPGGRTDAPWRLLQGVPVSGYEIHMGETQYGNDEKEKKENIRPFSILADGREDGCVRGSVLGTYLHGIFEEEVFTQKMIEVLCEDRGISYERLTAGDKGEPECEKAEPVSADFEAARCKTAHFRSYREFKESQYDLLADAVRRAFDMDKLYEIIFGA